MVDERRMAHMFRRVLRSAIGSILVKFARRLYPIEIKNWVEVRPVTLHLPRLDPKFDGFRLVQISDFHLGTWLHRQRLDQAIDLVNEQKPDFVAITGDFVTFDPEHFAPDLSAALQRLDTRYGAAAVFGNHDHWTNVRVLRQMLRAGGVKELSNTHLTLERDGACLHIAGVDCYMDNAADLPAVLRGLPGEGAAVLLAHEPDFADISAPTRRFDLQISGHSHGGQVQLPHFGAPFLPSFARKYPAGLYQVGGMYLYTNRGLGTAEIPIRFRCRAEITIYTLRSSNGTCKT